MSTTYEANNVFGLKFSSYEECEKFCTLHKMFDIDDRIVSLSEDHYLGIHVDLGDDISYSLSIFERTFKNTEFEFNDKILKPQYYTFVSSY